MFAFIVVAADDQLSGYRQGPVPGWLDKPGTGLEVLSTDSYELTTIDPVFPYQKSNCALNLKNRAVRTACGCSHVVAVGE